MDQHEAKSAERGDQACASCGAVLAPDARFCASCGDWIGAAQAVTELHPVPPVPTPGLRPTVLSREPLSWPRRVLLAVALLLCCALFALALRSVR